jgi:hypothetical protein
LTAFGHACAAAFNDAIGPHHSRCHNFSSPWVKLWRSAGILNIAVEGMMALGAFGGCGVLDGKFLIGLEARY